MKRIFFILIFFGSGFVFAQTGTVQISVKDHGTSKPVAGSEISILKNDSVIHTLLSDSAGNARITNIIPGMYDISCDKFPYSKQLKKGVHISNGRISFLIFQLKNN